VVNKLETFNQKREGLGLAGYVITCSEWPGGEIRSRGKRKGERGSETGRTKAPRLLEKVEARPTLGVENEEKGGTSEGGLIAGNRDQTIPNRSHNEVRDDDVGFRFKPRHGVVLFQTVGSPRVKVVGIGERVVPRVANIRRGESGGGGYAALNRRANRGMRMRTQRGGDQERVKELVFQVSLSMRTL